MLDSFDMRAKWKWSIFNPVWTRWFESGDEIENSFFVGNIELFQEKKYIAFVFLVQTTYMQKDSEFEVLSFAAEIRFCLIFVEICS